MALTLVQYRVKPAMIEENQRLIEAVFAELAARKPEGVKYASLHLGEGLFCHLVDGDTTALQALEAFKEALNSQGFRLTQRVKLHYTL